MPDFRFSVCYSCTLSFCLQVWLSAYSSPMLPPKVKGFRKARLKNILTGTGELFRRSVFRGTKSQGKGKWMFLSAFANSGCGEDIVNLGKELLLRGRKISRVSTSPVEFERHHLEPEESESFWEGMGRELNVTHYLFSPQDSCWILILKGRRLRKPSRKASRTEWHFQQACGLRKQGLGYQTQRGKRAILSGTLGHLS